MRTEVDVFRKLHYQQAPLLLGNAWDVQSAQTLQDVGFAAVATSSAAVARSLGYRDGEDMPFEDYLFIIARMKKVLHVPFSVDLEAGYGATPAMVADHIAQLHALGIVGINLEDTLVKNGERQLQEINAFADKLAEIIELLAARSIDMFLNVRTDAFLLRMPNALEESLKRIEAYQALQIDGLFLPLALAEDDILALLKLSKLPLNLMCVNGLPSYEALSNWGVKRISMGSLFHTFAFHAMEKTATEVLKVRDFAALFK
jgi:2-methylisocitrate lyase-like PEP mutase family enzyme